MWDLDNRTPFPAFQCFERDKNGVPHWLIVSKATFELRAGRACLFASHQQPLRFAPLYRQTANGPELLADVDVCFPRPNTDILLVGHGRAPLEGQKEAVVEMQVGNWRKRVEVAPARRWSDGRRPIAEIVEGEDEVWLGFSEAFGGGTAGESAGINPIGRGAVVPDAPAEHRDLPRLSYPGETLRRPEDAIRPAGFGPIPRDWIARARFAGTYDREWQRRKAPFLPDDFDELFHQTAPEDQRWDGIMPPGLPVRVAGLASGDLDFVVPTLRFECLTRFEGRWHEQDMALQSLHVFADESRLTLLHCGRLDVRNTAGEVNVAESRLRLLASETYGFTVRPEDASRFDA